MGRKPKRIPENSPPKFVIMNRDAEYFAGLRGGYPYWSPFFEEAKEFDEIEKYNFISKHEYYLHPELIYVKDL